jgi:hypothetical protein
MLFALIAAVLIGLWARSAFAEKKKQKEEPTELNKHPERLDQMLDPTDDA